VCVLSAGACVDDAGGDGNEASVTPAGDADLAAATVTSGALLPWKQGNTWNYRVTEDGEETTKVLTVGALEAVGGTGPNSAVQAHKTVTQKSNGAQTISWQKEVDGRVVRYREQAFKKSGALDEEQTWSPAKLHVDATAAHVAAGAAWEETYQETITEDGVTTTSTARDAWKVLGVDVAVTVPAGTFRAVQLEKTTGTSVKTYWFVPGVGKVKESGGQTEELTSYKLVP
jgi:hypothetical protein